MQRTVHVTNILSWVNFVYDEPYKPWTSARFENHGPSVVEIAINYPPHVDYGFTIQPGTAKDYNEGPINIIFLRATPGLDSKVIIIGES